MLPADGDRLLDLPGLTVSKALGVLSEQVSESAGGAGDSNDWRRLPGDSDWHQDGARARQETARTF
jgi:hypothetical protein